MDPPPPSLSQAVPKTTLFFNPDDTPIRVFTQADLFGRAKVLKELRLNGAELLSDATTAQIMLVDPQTRQGKLFIRDWGKDSNKTVLSFEWVRKSVEAERPLLAEDNWGGFLAQDDGRPIDCGQGLDGAMHEDHPKSPLPTPRVTPEELARMRSRTSNARQASLSASQPDDVSMAVLATPPAVSNSSASILPDTTQSQPLSPTDMSAMSGMNPFMFMQNPGTMNMQNIPASVLAITAQATQAMMANMLMNMNANMVPNQQQFSNDAFMLALQDTMRNHAVAGWPGMSPQNGVFPSSQSVSPLPDPPVPYPSAPSSSKTREIFDSPTPLSELPGPRRVSSTSEFERSSQKAMSKERATSPAAKRRKVSSSSTKDIEMGDARASTQADTSHEKLFQTKSGRPLSFFVQIEIHNRFKLVSSIKKSGGVIVDTPILADYAILYAGNQRQKVFKTLLHAAHNADVPAVQTKFIHDCLSKGKLLDPTDYLYESELKRKRKRSASIESEDESDSPEIDEAERKRLEKNARQAERRMRNKEQEIDETERKRLAKNAREAERRNRAKLLKEQEAKQYGNPSPASIEPSKPTPRRVKSIDAPYPRATDGARTPSPPPESARETCPQGYKFSQAENDFALRFGKIMLERDHTISQSAVVNAIYKKLPHHTLISWRSHFSVIAAEWDTWRKRSTIAHRKAQLRKEAEGVPSSSAPTVSMDAIELQGSPASINGTKTQSFDQYLEDDIKTVVRFFADGNDRDQTEDETLVWQRLEAKASCKTESSWETFYEKHAQVVIERYNAALD